MWSIKFSWDTNGSPNPGNWITKSRQLDHQIQANGSLNPGNWITKSRQKNFHRVDLPFKRAKIKIKENEKQTNTGNFLLRWKSYVQNMKITVILIIGGAHDTVHKGPEKRLGELEIRRRIETIQTTALLNQTRILRRVLEKTLGELGFRGRIETIQTTALLN